MPKSAQPVHRLVSRYARLFALLGERDGRVRNAKERRAAFTAEMKAVPDLNEFRALVAYDMRQAWERDRLPGASRNAHNRAVRWVGAYRVFRKYHRQLPKAVEVRAVGRAGLYELRFVAADKTRERMWGRFERLGATLGVPQAVIDRVRAKYDGDE